MGFRRFIGLVERPSAKVVTAVGFVLILVVAVGDYITGQELAFSFFYVAPILLISWVATVVPATLAVALAGAAFPLTDHLAGEIGDVLVALWNSLIRFGTLGTIAGLTRSLKAVLRHESELARTDGLTGLLNSRSFFEFAELEVARARRSGSPITLAYTDLDNFKVVNDDYGHPAGDEWLETFARMLSTGRRATDQVGRLGGDEFALLLPDTDASDALRLIERLRGDVAVVAAERGYPVTTSVGIVTFRSAPESVEQMIWAADQLMYSAKRAGKDQLRTQIVGEITTPSPIPST